MFRYLSWVGLPLFFLPVQVVMGLPHTEATCAPQYSWSYNSLGQSPCLVAAYLGNVCSSNNAYDVPANTNTSERYRPSVPAPSTCECNTVEWSLYMMCAVCQGGGTGTWDEWKVNCSNATIDNYPLDIPDGTAVPAWAYQNLASLTDEQFDPTLAQELGDTPEHTPPASNTSTTGVPQATTSSTANSDTKSNTGAVAGGIVGGLALLGLIGAGLFYILRKKNKDARQDRVVQNRNMPLMPATQSWYSSSKPYDPDDPSTFPAPQHTMSSLSSVRGGLGLTATTPDTIPRHTAYSASPPL